MDTENLFSGYKQGGNNYIKKADSKNKWCGFSKGVIDELKQRHGSAFNIVLWGNNPVDHYFCIPFERLEHLFTESLMTSGKYADKGMPRWTATIVNNIFLMRVNSEHSLHISEFYVDAGSRLASIFGELSIEFDVVYAIEDALADLKIRIGQSEFRSLVLSSFQATCCISSIAEPSLLVASHIIPGAMTRAGEATQQTAFAYLSSTTSILIEDIFHSKMTSRSWFQLLPIILKLASGAASRSSWPQDSCSICHPYKSCIPAVSQAEYL